MFSRSSGLVFLALSLCAQAVPSVKLYRQNQHQPATVVNQTSTAASAPPTILAATSNNKASGNKNDNSQTSLTLDPAVIAPGFAKNGQENETEPGQVASLTSENNYINFCNLYLPGVPITNGKQITTGSCNPAPMGLIPSTDNMPSAKFVNPVNMGTVTANKNFTITLRVAGFETGNFVNAQDNYFSAPQQLNEQGQIVGHSHIVVEALDSITQTTPNNPNKFAFFKGLNAAAENGLLEASVPGGLPAGYYRLSSINTAANHQPVLVPIAQHGSLDDVVYFTVTSDGATDGNGGQSNGGQSNSSAAPQASSTANPSKSKHHGKSSNVTSDATTSSPTSTSVSDSSEPCQ